MNDKLTVTNANDVVLAFGEEEQAWVNKTLQAWWDESDPDGERYEYVDNPRFCVVGDRAGEIQYEDREAGGCCGAVDHVIGPSPSGRFYRCGFNHGH